MRASKTNSSCPIYKKQTIIFTCLVSTLPKIWTQINLCSVMEIMDMFTNNQRTQIDAWVWEEYELSTNKCHNQSITKTTSTNSQACSLPPLGSRATIKMSQWAYKAQESYTKGISSHLLDCHMPSEFTDQTYRKLSTTNKRKTYNECIIL